MAARLIKETTAGVLRRFDGYVNRDGAVARFPLTPCWEWAGCPHASGYGKFAWKAKEITLAHRAAWELYVGAIPPRMLVLHVCDNPPCVNPSHLFLGTDADNANDKSQKGRCRSGHIRLTADDVVEIRRLYVPHRNSAALGERFGIRQAHVWAIAKGRAWSHVK